MPRLDVVLNSDFVIYLIWCMIGINVALVMIPPFLHAIGLSRCRCSVEKTGPAGVLGAQEVNPEYIGQLQQLGFAPLAVIRKRIWFLIQRWTWSVREYVFVLETENCVATVYKLSRDDSTRVTLATYFESGRGVFSNNFSLGAKNLPKTWVVHGMTTGDLSELLARHQEAVNQLKGPAERVSCCANLEVILEQGLREERAVIAANRGEAFRQMVTLAFIVGSVPASIVLFAFLEKGPGRHISFVGLRIAFLLASVVLVCLRHEALTYAIRRKIRRRHREIKAFNEVAAKENGDRPNEAPPQQIGE